jgi:penicillin amidase
VYADTDGNIGWQAAGSAPIRSGWSGLLPVPGSSGRYEWMGWLPLSELPRAYNPSKHFIATANHKVIPNGYKHEINFEWSAPFRFQRIEELLSKGSKFTVEDFERLQHDETSLPARDLVPILLRTLSVDSRTQMRDAYELLKGWDYKLERGSAAAALYETWLQKLQVKFAAHVVPAEVQRLVEAGSLFRPMLRALKAPDSKIFGDTPQVKASLMMSESLLEAISDLQSKFGKDMTKWRWGDLHFAEFKHSLSVDDVRRAVFDLRSVPRDGDANTVNATAGTRFIQRSGASFREILDLSDWDNSVAINVPGQSAQPESRHYSDLLPLWSEGKYFPLLFSRAKIEKNTAQRLVLEPKRATQATKQ